jgi:2-succinyl-5-enolpyruvyl-6-hydroxy-3-cyclohexene-1-carboxylate synthase
MSDTGALNLRWAQTLVSGLVAAGVSEAVLSPGSRSSPLALACVRARGLRCHVLFDERSAAFFALGLAKATGRPAALVCTSGSAPANWFPAVIEADEGGVPLLLLSADRPPELTGWGANQTIDQGKLFGAHVRAAHALGTPEAEVAPAYLHRLAARAVAEALGARPGPVHLNLPFREPLLPVGEPPTPEAPAPVAVSAARRLPEEGAIERLAATLSGQPGAIVCGGGDHPPGFAEAVTRLAGKLDCPLLAEPLSGLRFGPHDRSRLVVRYEAFLRPPAFAATPRPAWLLRFGTFPVTRALQGWLAAASAATHILVDPAAAWRDPLHASAAVVQADPVELCRALEGRVGPGPGAWGAAFRQAEARASELAARHAEGEEAYEGALIPALLAALPEGAHLFCGNSMAIRDLDAFSGSGAKRLCFHGNRGASGIDGNVSTAAGIAAARGLTLALLGDLACAHDLTGLAAARGQELVLVVVNNGGGAIFGYLPQAGLPEFERAWLAPSGLDFAHAAAAWGLAYRRADSVPGFRGALSAALAAGGPHLIEVMVDRSRSLARHRAYWEAVAEGS